MKKTTLFLDRTLRDSLSQPGGSSWTVAYRTALSFYAKIVYHMTVSESGLSQEVYDQIVNNGEQYKVLKYLTTLVREAQKANRVEVCLTLRWYKTLTLEVRGYRTGEKKPYHKTSFGFSEKDGSFAGISSEILS